MVLEKPTAPPARSHNTNFFRAQGARLREDHTSFSCISWGFIGTSSPAASVEGARRSPCNAESCKLRPPGYSQAILAPALLCANSVQIGLLKPYDPGLTEADAEVLFKHGLEDGSGYPLCVDEDGAWYTGVHRLKKIPGALGDYDDVVVLLSQVPALQLAV